ncbi:hypothetical protein DSL72_004083 [Monilinia vaccinii-corymbosi]|uniref:Uncharacterized protein n=1 Tax=Monilinia vaccinii-corymbosi TaxID=61207 RepID=A0A8A3P6W9_9HELO|nr:hypothetical protein DSL72_004083 [Monilinia vaccinii-corymbosi]
MASNTNNSSNHSSTSNHTAEMPIDSVPNTSSPDATAPIIPEAMNAMNAMIANGKTIDYHLLPVRQLITMLSARRLVPSFKDSLVILLLIDDERQYRAANQAPTGPSAIRPVVAGAQQSRSPELGSQEDLQASLDNLEEMADRYLARRQGSENLRSRAEEPNPTLPSNPRQ